MTREPRHVEWMHAEIDGVATPEEQAALRELLASDPSAREDYERLRRLCETLESMEALEPPSSLRADVLRSVRASRSGRPLRATTRVRAWWPGTKVVLRFGYAVAAGLVLGVVLLRWAPFAGDGPGLDPSALVGAMVSHPATGTAGVVERVSMSLPGGTGSATVRRIEAGYAIEIELAVERPGRVALRFDPEALLLRGFARDPGGVRDLEAAAGRFEWTQGGKGRLTVLLSPMTSAESGVVLEWSSEGKSFKNSDLRVPGKS